MPRTRILVSIALVNAGAWLMVAGCELAFPTRAAEDAGTDGTAGDDATGRADAEDAAADATDASRDTNADAMSSGDGADTGGDVLADALGDSQEASSVPTLVQQVAGAANNVTMLTISLDASIAAGDTLLLLTSTRDYPVTGASGGGVQSWYSPFCGGPHSIMCGSYGSSGGGDAGVTLTLGTATTEALAYNLSEWRNVSAIVPSSIVDDFPQGGMSASMVFSPSIDASAGQLVVVAIDTDVTVGGGQTVSVTGPGGGVAPLSPSSVPSTNGGTQLWPAYLVAPSAGTSYATWTLSPSDGWDGIGMAFQP